MKAADLLADQTGQPRYLVSTTERRVVSQDQLTEKAEHEKPFDRR